MGEGQGEGDINYNFGHEWKWDRQKNNRRAGFRYLERHRAFSILHHTTSALFSSDKRNWYHAVGHRIDHHPARQFRRVGTVYFQADAFASHCSRAIRFGHRARTRRFRIDRLWLGRGRTGKRTILLLVLFGLLIWVFVSKTSLVIWNDFRSLLISFRDNRNEIPRWLPSAVLVTTLLGFLFSLLPPAEGFDGLFYHLTMPERLLADRQILPYNVLQFWFPGLIEGDFLLALGLRSERTAQLIHWSFSMLTLALVWEWSRNLFGHKSAWWSLAMLISMPSLPWISSWAYTDLALTFVGLACLYSLWRWSNVRENVWLTLTGLFAGMGMGIKYTSFILPVLCFLLILVWEKDINSRITSTLRFSIPALLVALPWYLRNWLVMGNPFYPFVFGGRFWDSFRTTWYNGSGTGIGWNIRELLLLPFTITLGHRDQNFYDGRIRPLFLLLIPFALWILWKKRAASQAERKALLILSAFFGLNFAFWTFGVIQTASLWQSRLLWPGLIPFAIPIGLAISHLADFDLPRLRISFIATALIALVIAVTLLDNSLSSHGPQATHLCIWDGITASLFRTDSTALFAST